MVPRNGPKNRNRRMIRPAQDDGNATFAQPRENGIRPRKSMRMGDNARDIIKGDPPDLATLLLHDKKSAMYGKKKPLCFYIDDTIHKGKYNSIMTSIPRSIAYLP